MFSKPKPYPFFIWSDDDATLPAIVIDVREIVSIMYANKQLTYAFKTGDWFNINPCSPEAARELIAQYLDVNDPR